MGENITFVHAVCISRSMPKKFPKSIRFSTDYHYGTAYGWVCTPEEKASYMWNIVLSVTDKSVCSIHRGKFDEYKDKIVRVLKSRGIEPEFGQDTYASFDSPDYIDFLSKLMENENLILMYLFGANSVIITGNSDKDSSVWHDADKLKDACKIYFIKELNNME